MCVSEAKKEIGKSLGVGSGQNFNVHGNIVLQAGHFRQLARAEVCAAPLTACKFYRFLASTG